MKVLCVMILFVSALNCQQSTISSVFGIQLGVSPTLPVCPTHTAKAITKKHVEALVFDPVSQDTCIIPCQTRDLPDLGIFGQVCIAPAAPLSNARNYWTIRFPVSRMPIPLTTQEQMTALALDGKIEAITFFTGGLSSNDVVFPALRKKYGEPAAIHTTPMQNGFGADFDAILALWHVGDITVVYEAGNVGRDSGSVEVSTSKGSAVIEDLRKAGETKFSKNRPQL